jgi:hypothetical protein
MNLRDKAREQTLTEEMIKNKIVEESNSPWSSPVVKKKRQNMEIFY